MSRWNHHCFSLSLGGSTHRLCMEICVPPTFCPLLLRQAIRLHTCGTCPPSGLQTELLRVCGVHSCPCTCLALKCWLVCQSSCGLFFNSFFSRRLSSSRTCHLLLNCQTSAFSVPSKVLALYHWGAYTCGSAGRFLPITSQPTSGNCSCWKIIKWPRVLVLIVKHC